MEQIHELAPVLGGFKRRDTCMHASVLKEVVEKGVTFSSVDIGVFKQAENILSLLEEDA